MKRSVLCLSAIVVASLGCHTIAPPPTADMFQPPELDRPDIQPVAVFDLEDPRNGPSGCGSTIANAIVANLNQAHAFQIVERQNIKKVQEEDALRQRGAVENVLRAGKLAGARSVLIGQVESYNSSDVVSKEESSENREKEPAGKHVLEISAIVDPVSQWFKQMRLLRNEVMADVIKREATVAFSCKLIEVDTGVVLWAKQFSHSQTYNSMGGIPPLPAHQTILSQLLGRCLTDLTNALVPHTMTAVFETGSYQLDQGIRFAHAKDWDAARTSFTRAVQSERDNTAGWYDLGLAWEAQGNYVQAQKAFEEAAGRKAKPLYVEAVERQKSRVTASLQELSSIGISKAAEHGLQFARAGLWDEARREWGQIVKDAEKDHATWYCLGTACEMQGDYPAAADAFEHAVKLQDNPRYTQARDRVRQKAKNTPASSGGGNSQTIIPRVYYRYQSVPVMVRYVPVPTAAPVCVARTGNCIAVSGNCVTVQSGPAVWNNAPSTITLAPAPAVGVVPAPAVNLVPVGR